MNLECSICMEYHRSLKYLYCHHSFCLKCLSRIKKVDKDGRSTISCPFDRENTVLLSADGEKYLRSKFGVMLTCEECSEENSVSKCWWCKSCETSVCSTCAMTKHRNHTCNNWEEYDAVKDCVKLVSSFDFNPKEFDEKIHSFCINLEKSLKSRYSYIDECKKFMTDVQNVFGNLEPSSDTISNKKLEKVLTTISKIVCFQDENNIMPDIDTLKDLPGKQLLTQQLVFPDINDIVNKTFQFQKDKNCELQVCDTTKNASIDKSQKSTFQLNWDIVSLKLSLATPISLCAVPNGLLILNDKGIYKFDNICKTFKLQKEWEKFPENSQFAFLPTMIYHPERQSIFITIQCDPAHDFGMLEEYSSFDLNFLQGIGLPRFHQRFNLNAPCLVTTLRNGQIACASGIDGQGYIWIKPKHHLNDNWWIKAWAGKDLKKFLAVKIMSRNDTEILLIISESFIYEFSLIHTGTEFSIIRKVSIPKDGRSFMVYQNDMFYLNKSLLKLCTVFEVNESKNITVEGLHFKGKEITYLEGSLCGKFIYCFQSIESLLLVGTIRLQKQLSTNS